LKLFIEQEKGVPLNLVFLLLSFDYWIFGRLHFGLKRMFCKLTTKGQYWCVFALTVFVCGLKKVVLHESKATEDGDTFKLDVSFSRTAGQFNYVRPKSSLQ